MTFVRFLLLISALGLAACGEVYEPVDLVLRCEDTTALNVGKARLRFALTDRYEPEDLTGMVFLFGTDEDPLAGNHITCLVESIVVSPENALAPRG